MKKLYRSPHNKKLMGVCGGLAKYLNIDPTLVRLGWVIISLIPITGGPLVGVLGYILCGFIIPIEPDYIDITDIKEMDD